MNDEDDGDSWQDECFRMIRIVTAFVVEYSPLVLEPDSLAGWALADLRTMNHDLLQAAMDHRHEAAQAVLLEARTVLAQLIRYID